MQTFAMPTEPRLAITDRIFAGVEVLLGAAIVILHNVYRRVPNEVPLLVLILWGSLLFRRKAWSSVGFARPQSWTQTILVSLCAGVLLQLKDFVSEPLAHLIWHQPERVSAVITNVHHHSVSAALQSLAIVWTFAAFGEEFAYRALLLRRAADAFGGSRPAYAAAVLFSSILFGFGHFYKGPTGIFDSALSGLILAAACLVTRRNLWAPILAHGIGDTIAVAYNFLAA